MGKEFEVLSGGHRNRSGWASSEGVQLIGAGRRDSLSEPAVFTGGNSELSSCCDAALRQESAYRNVTW